MLKIKGIFIEGEGEEKQRDQGERKDEKRKTAMVALLVSIMAFGYT